MTEVKTTTMIVTIDLLFDLVGLRRSLRPFGVKAVLIEPGTHKTHLTSTQNYSNLLTAAWNGASEEAKAEYGEEFLKECTCLGYCIPLSFPSSAQSRSISN